MKNIEEEIALIILDDPEDVISEIISWNSIADYKLISQDTQIIHDVYFDNLDRELQKKKLALRIRTIGGKNRITLKGPSTTGNKNITERMEIEDQWSKDSLKKIIKELTRNKIKLSYDVPFQEQSLPSELMKRLGLIVIQDRTTKRNTMIIHNETDAVGELAIDEVAYHFARKDVKQYCIEIEAKTSDSTMIESVLNGLIDTYGKKLKLWKYSKLATGLIIEKLLNEGIGDFVDGSGYLKRTGYDKIEIYMKNHNF